MRRTGRAALALLAFLTLATPIPPGPDPGPGSGAVAGLFAERVALNPDRPGDRRLGPLRYVAGWVLTSDDRRFGSISAIHVEGGRITAAGDRGIIFRFSVPGTGPPRVGIAPLTEGPGTLADNVERDTESMAVLGGDAWLGYENSNQIWRYRRADWRAAGWAAPALMRGWPANRGAEAMVRLSDGRFLVIGEDEGPDGASPAMLFLGDPADPATRAVPARYRPPRGHRFTDAALLPNGRLLLLSRGFTLSGGWSAALLTAALPARPGEIIQTFAVATLSSPLTVDNMEALGVTREHGRTIVWIASDDNLNPVQRTLLLKFEVAE